MLLFLCPWANWRSNEVRIVKVVLFAVCQVANGTNWCLISQRNIFFLNEAFCMGWKKRLRKNSESSACYSLNRTSQEVMWTVYVRCKQSTKSLFLPFPTPPTWNSLHLKNVPTWTFAGYPWKNIGLLHRCVATNLNVFFCLDIFDPKPPILP